jgi:hypothetical protein
LTGGQAQPETRTSKQTILTNVIEFNLKFSSQLSEKVSDEFYRLLTEPSDGVMVIRSLATERTCDF